MNERDKRVVQRIGLATLALTVAIIAGAAKAETVMYGAGVTSLAFYLWGLVSIPESGLDTPKK